MAVTANQLVTAQQPDGLVGYPVLASTHIYKGTMCFVVAASGYLTDDDASGANAFAGIASQEVDNSSGSNGDLTCECWTEGKFELVGSSLTQAIVGDKIYATDNYTITGTGTSATRIGNATEFVSATKAMVQIRVGDQTDAIA